jgi:Zn-dependent protease with chaperone function
LAKSRQKRRKLFAHYSADSVAAAALALAIFAFALAWPVPVLLGRARWPQRSPAVALVLWQAIAIAGGLSMIGALAVFGLAPYGDDVLTAVLNLDDSVHPWNMLALSAAVLLTAHLLVNLVATVMRSERERRRHARLVLLLSAPFDAATRIIDSPTPVAYCLPGAFQSITVFSHGLVELLSAEELRAVIEHERAHATQRHDVVLIAFKAWRASLPWFPIAYRAQREVGLLIEMLADDRARRTVDDDVLARAIALVGNGTVDAGDLRLRVERLPLQPLSPLAAIIAVAGAIALLVVPSILLLAAVVVDASAR